MSLGLKGMLWKAISANQLTPFYGVVQVFVSYRVSAARRDMMFTFHSDVYCSTIIANPGCKNSLKLLLLIYLAEKFLLMPLKVCLLE